MSLYLFQLSDVLNCYTTSCPKSQPLQDNALKLSLDGVSESRSTNISLDVYSVKINDCKSVFPIRIIRPLCKFSVDYMSNFEKVLMEIDQNNCQLTHVIADLSLIHI